MITIMLMQITYKASLSLKREADILPWWTMVVLATGMDGFKERLENFRELIPSTDISHVGWIALPCPDSRLRL